MKPTSCSWKIKTIVNWMPPT